MSCLYLIFALPINHIKLYFQEYTENKCSMSWPCGRMYFQSKKDLQRLTKTKSEYGIRCKGPLHPEAGLYNMTINE